MLQGFLQEVRDLDTSRRSLKSFGIVVGSVLTLIALAVMWRSGSWDGLEDGRPRIVTILGSLGILLVATALLRPPLLRPVYVVWMGLALVLGAVMTRVILTLVFVFLIVPTGLIMKLSGRDPLNRTIEASAGSYWMTRTDADRSPERLEKYY